MPVAGVSGQPKGKLVMSPILVGLIRVVLRTTIARGLHAGRAQECEADGIVVALVGAVLEVGETCWAEGPALVGEIDPAMRCDLKLTVVSVGALDGSDLPVVGGVLVGGAKGEGGFEVGGEGSPVDRV